MNKSKIEKVKKDLLQQLGDLEENKSQTRKGIVVDEQYADVTDRASYETEQHFELRIRDRERKLIGKIKKTLEKIETGTFGICDSCGEEIGEERLLARPVTDLCINCKSQQEHEEKHYEE